MEPTSDLGELQDWSSFAGASDTQIASSMSLAFTCIDRLRAGGREFRSGGQSGPAVYFNVQVGQYMYFIYLSILITSRNWNYIRTFEQYKRILIFHKITHFSAHKERKNYIFPLRRLLTIMYQYKKTSIDQKT